MGAGKKGKKSKRLSKKAKAALMDTGSSAGAPNQTAGATTGTEKEAAPSY